MKDTLAISHKQDSITGPSLRLHRGVLHTTRPPDSIDLAESDPACQIVIPQLRCA